MFESLLNTMRNQPWAFAIPLAIVCAFAHRVLTRRGLIVCEATPPTVSIAQTVCIALLTAALAWLEIAHRVQLSEDVVPQPMGEVTMLVYHLTLAVLLLSAASVDFRTGYIPDFIPIYGAVIGIAVAVAIGDVQIMHVWCDWTKEAPQLAGPFRPDWMSEHPHLHGLAWSAAGLFAGAGLTLLLRWLSGLIIGQEALGMGDVFLMGMAGSFVGWQPIVIALAIAPLTALLGAGAVWLTGDKRQMPYGPFLAAGVLITLFAWRFIWMFEFDFGTPHGPAQQADFALRRMFGDPIGLLMIAGGTLVLLTLLLGLLRWVKSVPIEKLAGRRH